jgi:hypothetical protein
MFAKLMLFNVLEYPLYPPPLIMYVALFNSIELGAGAGKVNGKPFLVIVVAYS